VIARDVLDLLSHLVDKSLVNVSEHEGQARYRMLETIREYAREKLNASGEVEAIRSRHLEYFMKLAEAAEPMLFTHGVLWFGRLEAEMDNIRAALDWSMEAAQVAGALGKQEIAEAGLRLAAALAQFLQSRSSREWSELLRKLVTDAGSARITRWPAKALNVLGILYFSLGNYDQAHPVLEDGLALARQFGDRLNASWALL
jgi:non-specific serine/threonine protein kinase